MSSYAQKKNSVKITKDYSYTLKGDPSAPIGQFGGASREDRTFSFKAGQIVEGYIQDSGTNIQVQVGNNSVLIPKSNWEIVVNPSFIQETDIDRGNNQPNQVAPQSFIEKHKNHLLIAVALVLGYFAYKKFKN
jgi:hypothetical protein